MKLIRFLLAITLLGTCIAGAFGLDPAAAIGGVGVASIVASATGMLPQGVLSANVLTITDIISQYGSYYLDSGQNQADVLRSFRRTRTLPTFAQARTTKNTIAQLSVAQMTSVLQPFHKTFSSKGDATFIANKIELFHVKVDQRYTPDDILESWLAWAADPSNAERADWPIVRYIWEVLVAERAQQDHEHTDWAGEQAAAPGGGTAGPYLDSYDGLRTLIIAGLANATNPMHALDLNGLDPSDPDEVFDAIEYATGSAAGIPQFWRGRPVDIYVPETMELAYFRNRRGTFNALESARANPGGPMTIDGRPNWRIVPFGGMDMAGDEANLFITPRFNVLHYTQAQSYSMGVDKDTREAKLYADWREGLGFGVNDMVYAYIPESSGSGDVV